MKVIYDSPLREFLISEDKEVVETVIPEMCAYRAITIILGIMNTKANERRKEIEKAEREGKKLPFIDNSIVEENKKMTDTEE